MCLHSGINEIWTVGTIGVSLGYPLWPFLWKIQQMWYNSANSYWWLIKNMEVTCPFHVHTSSCLMLQHRTVSAQYRTLLVFKEIKVMWPKHGYWSETFKLLAHRLLLVNNCCMHYTLPKKKRNFNFKIFYGHPWPGSVTPDHVHKGKCSWE